MNHLASNIFDLHSMGPVIIFIVIIDDDHPHCSPSFDSFHPMIDCLEGICEIIQMHSKSVWIFNHKFNPTAKSTD